MLTSTLRAVGGSVMMAIPKPLLDSMGLGPNVKVALRIEDGRLVVEPQPRPRYSLAELVARVEALARRRETGAVATTLKVGDLEMDLIGRRVPVEHGPERFGDIRHSVGATARSRDLLSFEPGVSLRAGLAATLEASPPSDGLA